MSDSMNDAELAAIIRVAKEEEPSRAPDSLRFVDALTLPHRWESALPEMVERKVVIDILARAVRQDLDQNPAKSIALRMLPGGG